MILTDKEIQTIRQKIEEQGSLDDELLRRCRHLLHMEAYDEAVRSAFVLLEERLRKAIGEDGMTGTNLANKAFAKDSSLAMHLGRTPSEREGLRELYSGAFKLFRNPTAHGAVGYDAADGKAIIGMVNLMLGMIKRVGDLPSPDLFPANVEKILEDIGAQLGMGEASRLRLFLGKCIKAGMTPRKDAKTWIPFRRHALVQLEKWEEPKTHQIAVFYLANTAPKQFSITFSTSYYYPSIVGFNMDKLVDNLQEIGFVAVGKNREPGVDLQVSNNQPFFDNLYDILMTTIKELDETLED
jgi:uncharacterized protein (TIGR02391 family)